MGITRQLGTGGKPARSLLAIPVTTVRNNNAYGRRIGLHLWDP